MDTLKSKSFWGMLVAQVAITVLAALDKVPGKDAMYLIGMLGGVTVAAGGVGGQGVAAAAKRIAPILLAALAAGGGSMMLGGCGTTIGQQLSAAQQAAVGARKAATTYYDAECLARARKCGPAPTACPPLEQCQAERHQLYQAASAVQLGIKTVAVVAALDPDQGAALLPGLIKQAADLWAAVKRAAGGGLPSSLPAGR